MAVPTLTANSPSAGFIAWSAFTIQYNGVAYSVAASNTNATYTAWLYNGGAPLLAVNNNAPTMSAVANGTSAQWAGASPVLGPDDLLLFVNRSGVPINVQAAQLIDGDMIVTGTITSANIATGTIVANNIASGTITANEIATDTILAGNIAANAIGTSELSAGSVVSDKVAAGAITTEKLTIGSVSDNLVMNPFFEDANAAGTGPANWSTTNGQQTGSPTFLWTAKIDGAKSIGIGPNSSANGGSWTSQPFPVSPGTVLAVNGLLQASAAANGSAYVRVYYGTTNAMTWNTGLIAGTPAVPAKCTVTDVVTSTVVVPTTLSGVGSASIMNAWTPTSTNIWRFQGQTTVPTGASWAMLALYNWTNATGGCTIYYDDVEVNAVLITAQIGDGVITANQIAANTITASQIAANTINTAQLNASAINGMTISSNTINTATINSSTINSSTFTLSGSFGNMYMSAAGGDTILFRNSGSITPTGVTYTSGNAYIISQSVKNGGTAPGILIYGGDNSGTTQGQGSTISLLPDSIGITGANFSRNASASVKVVGNMLLMAGNGWDGHLYIGDGTYTNGTAYTQFFPTPTNVTSPTVLAWYRLLPNKCVFVQIALTAGSVTTAGTAITFPLPSGIVGSSLMDQPLMGRFNNNVPTYAQVLAGGTSVQASPTNVSGANYTAGQNMQNLRISGVFAIN